MVLGSATPAFGAAGGNGAGTGVANGLGNGNGTGLGNGNGNGATNANANGINNGLGVGAMQSNSVAGPGAPSGNGTPNANANSNANGAGGNGGNGGAGNAPANTPPSSPSGAGNAPPGNNGTIKIDQYTMDPGMDNDPHLSCGFSVSFFGYDGGPQQATIKVTPWAPTSGGNPTTFGPVNWNVGTRTSGNQFDANYPVSWSQLTPVLAGITPAKQGYHVRIEVEVTGSQGSDDKYKMVWLEPCATSPGTPPPPPGTPPPPPGTPPPPPGTPPPPPPGTPPTLAGASNSVIPPVLTTASLPLVDTAPALSTRGAGDVMAASAPGHATLVGALAFTGLVLLPIVSGGVALTALGFVLTRWSRRRQRLA